MRIQTYELLGLGIGRFGPTRCPLGRSQSVDAAIGVATSREIKRRMEAGEFTAIEVRGSTGQTVCRIEKGEA